jgi:hypothetical protein
MLTLFSTPKPFQGHIGVIQNNAIQSWRRLHPDVDVILFGDDQGAAEAARAFGFRHVPAVERNEHGTKYLASIFDQAQELARHDVLCYVNCDIVLMDDFFRAQSDVAARFPRFLMVGRRWDTDVHQPIPFDETNWQEQIQQKAREQNHQRPPQWIDYFVFRRGLYYKNTPPFVIGRPGWDNWLLWKARSSGASVVDASAAVMAVHQNHDYSYHPDGEAGVWQGEEAQRNYALLENGRCFRTIENATHRLTLTGLQRNLRHWAVLADRSARRVASRLWFDGLNATRSLRHRLGLRSSTAVQPEAVKSAKQ